MPIKYSQKGGFSFFALLAQIIIEILMAIWGFIKDILKVCPNDEAADWKECYPQKLKHIDPRKWEWGALWYYLKWCVKTVIYIIIFCFGGPIVILIGVAYLYSQLFTKLGERTDGVDPNEINKDENNNSNSQG
jgi:hypothetical protein